MNRIEKILIAGGTGTSVMTASSALMSLLPKEEFREPDQLEKLVGRLLPFLSPKGKTMAGWAAHYGMGMLFSAVYVELWESGKVKPNVKTGLVLGGVSGVVGMLIWQASFWLHPFPPNNRKLDFYLQRIPAHIVFAVFATLAYRLVKRFDQRGHSPETGQAALSVPLNLDKR